MSRNQFLSLLLLSPAALLLFMSYILVYSHNPVLNPEETMAKVTTAEDLRALQPFSQGIIFTPGPHSTQNRASLCGSRQRSIKSAAATPVSSVPDPTLFSWDIGQILLQKIAEKEDEMKKAFQMLDVGQMLTVTKGEFRRAIETFLFHLTEVEVDAGLAEVEQPHLPNNDIKSAGNPAQGESTLTRVVTETTCWGSNSFQIAKNVKNIIMCCRLFDYSHAGWIQGHILRQILEITCFRMKDSEFEKPWNHYCVRNSKVIDYKEFLKNFGISTDTVKVKSTENEVRMCSVYQDIEKAFRAIDVSQSGFVSLDYLKSVISGFIFPLPNETFRELMNRVNPARGDEVFFSDTALQKLHRYIQHAYSSLKQAFLMLDEKQVGKITRNDLRRVLHNLVFQVKDKDFQGLIEIIDPEQTGYLDCHEFLDLFEEKESVVEEILSDAITENWKDFRKALQSCDPKCTGTIKRGHLRKVLQLWFSSLSDQQSMKIKQIEDQANKYAQNRTVEEVIKRLKDRVIQQTATTKGSFFAYNKHGKINKAGLWKVLEDHGMPMDDSQFNLLTEKLRLPDGGLSFLDFVAILEDARLNGPGATLCNSANHGVNDAKYHYMTAEECLNQLNDKLMEVYGDTYSAFRETDSNHDGIINMLDFHQFLDSFLLRLRGEEFLRLLGLLGMNLTSTLNYQEFCQLFHTQETKEVSPRVMPSHKKKQMITDAELACDHAHYYLVIKARTRWHDLARNFQEFDSEGKGIIQPRDLKTVLFRFGIPITLEEFKQLWARYDTDAKRYLTHQEFLHKLGIEFAPADKGLSNHITDNSYAHLQLHYNNQQKKCSKLEEQQKQQTKALHVREIKKQINLGISIHDSKLSYFDFLRAIDDGRASKYQQRQKQAAPPASFAALSLGQTLINIKEIVASSYDLLYKTEEGQKVIPPKSSLELSDQGILSQVQEVMTAGFNTIAQEFKDTASSKDNTVSKEEFWDICNRHQRLTEEQFENLWNIVDFNAGGRLKDDDYLKKFISEVVTMPSSTPGATGSATSAKPAAHTMQDPRVSSHPERPKT